MTGDLTEDQIPPDVRARLAKTADRDRAFWQSVIAGRRRLTIEAALDDNEAAMRKKHGSAVVDARSAAYRKLLESDPALGKWVLDQDNPWQWVVETLPKLLRLAEEASRSGRD